MESNEKFENILDAELEALVRAGVVYGMTADDRDRATRNAQRATAALSALVDALSLEELREYGEYRKADRKS